MVWADQPFALIAIPKATEATQNHSCVRVATEMAHAHNALLRALNSVYLQSEQLKSPKDQADCVLYVKYWIDWIAHHHHGEEEMFFPEVEELGKEAGIAVHMTENIAQHHAFEPGLKNLSDWVARVEKDTSLFNPKELKGIIDGFGAILQEHLKDEIDTLMELHPVDSKKLLSSYLRFDLELRKGEKDVLYPLVFGTADKTFDGGNNFPEVPFFVPYLIHYHFERKWSSVWRFNPCDSWSKPRPLVFLD